MAKSKIGKWEIEENELDEQHQNAVVRGEQIAQSEPQAQSVTYDALTNRLVILLKNDVQMSLPCRLIQGLENAPPQEIATVQLGRRGASLHWQTLDVDLSLAGLLTGIFGTRAWMAEIGKRGGQVRSATKVAAARQNGKRGGRPKTLVKELTATVPTPAL